MKASLLLVVAVAIASLPSDVFASCEPANSQACKNMRDAANTHKKLEQEKNKEATRDKSHDGRLKTGKDSSVGVGTSGVNVKKTFQ